MPSIEEMAEQQNYYRRQGQRDTSMIFETRGSTGSNNEKLARLLSAFDFFINLMKWQDKPIARFSHIVTQYQASVDTKYHNDYKDVLVAEEIERKRAERKGISITASK